MQNTVYLLIKSDYYSIQLLEKILLMLVGGYPLKCHSLQLVAMDMIGDGNTENESNFSKMSELVRQYNNVRSNLKSFKTNMCNTEVTPVKLLKYSPHDIGQYSILPNNIDVKRSLGILKSLSDTSFFHLEAKDKIILATSINDNFDDLNITRSILSHFSKNRQDIYLSVIYDLTNLLQINKKLPANLVRAINVLEKECNLVLVGLSDMYKPTFTQLQTACAVLDAINYNVHGEPMINGERKNLCYSSQNLPSGSASNALIGLALLGKLWNDGIENVVSSWIKNLRIKDPWNEIPFLYSITPFLSYLHQWMENSSNTDFSIDINDDVYRELTKGLNNVTVLPKTSSQEQRRKEATLSLLLHVGEKSDSGQSKITYKPISIPDTNSKWEYKFGQQIKDISPTISFDLMDLAFSEDYFYDKEASTWRSICLDLWEMLFVNDKRFVDSFFEIKECIISKEQNSIEKELLAFSEVGRMIIDADVFYYVRGKKQTFLAYTSPLTGFCVSEYADCPVEINSHYYLSNKFDDVYELKDRSVKFQQFLYSYINMRKNMFSDNFKNYIENQIERNKALIQSKGNDIIKLFPQYREHIPLDIEIAQNV